MKAGAFVASGQDTCVYDPPLKCVDSMPELPPGTHVSRVILSTDREVSNQMDVKQVIDQVEAEHPGMIAKYFNLMTDHCNSFEVTPEDVSNQKGEGCEVLTSLKRPGVKKGYTNIRTPKQLENIVIGDKKTRSERLSRPADVTARALYPLMKALAYIRGRFIHTDAHRENIAWMPDGRLVLFDWGRASIHTRTVQSLMIQFDINPDEYREYDQYAFNVGMVVNEENKDPERLRAVFDLLSILRIIEEYGILPRGRAIAAVQTIYSLAETHVPSSEELIGVLDTMFEGMTGGRRKTRKHKSKKKRTIRRKRN